MKKDKQTAAIGDWAYFCCERELRLIENGSQLDGMLEDWDDMGYRAFSDRDEALDDIARNWKESGMPDRAKLVESMKNTA